MRRGPSLATVRRAALGPRPAGLHTLSTSVKAAQEPQHQEAPAGFEDSAAVHTPPIILETRSIRCLGGQSPLLHPNASLTPYKGPSKHHSVAELLRWPFGSSAVSPPPLKHRFWSHEAQTYFAKRPTSSSRSRHSSSWLRTMKSGVL